MYPFLFIEAEPFGSYDIGEGSWSPEESEKRARVSTCESIGQHHSDSRNLCRSGTAVMGTKVGCGGRVKKRINSPAEVSQTDSGISGTLIDAIERSE